MMKYDIVLFADNMQKNFIDSVSKTHNIKRVISSNTVNSSVLTSKGILYEIELYHPKKTYDFKNAICVLFLFKKIIDINKIQSQGIYNFHYGLLPDWRGNSCNVWSLLNGVNFIGYSFHQVNNKMDDGVILYKYQIELKNEETYFNKRVSIIDHSIDNAPTIISKIQIFKPIAHSISSPIYTPRAKYSDTQIESFDINVNLFNGMYRAFSGSDWGFNVSSSLGLLKISTIKIFNNQKNVVGFVGRVVNFVEVNQQTFTVVKVSNGYVYIGKVFLNSNLYNLSDLVKIGKKL